MRRLPRSFRQLNRCILQRLSSCGDRWQHCTLLQVQAVTGFYTSVSLRPFRFNGSLATVVAEREVSTGLDDVDSLEAFLERYPDAEVLEEDDEDVRLLSLPAQDVSQRSFLASTALSAKLASSEKWQTLTRDHRRLQFESRVNSQDGKSVLLVDDAAHSNDVELWNCLLAFRYRREGAQGVAAILEGLQIRRTLHEVEGDAAAVFWQTILNEATCHEELLESAWEYAEWMYEAHRVRWPNMYQTVISYFVSRRREKDALRWHIRLSPSFGLEAPAFARLLQRFIKNPDPDIQRILMSLYHLTPHRRLYDSLVPYLYAQGTQKMARKWRKFLLCYNDVPASLAARPFLRFLAGYFPRDLMVRSEFLAAGIEEPAHYRDDIPGNDVVDSSFTHLVNRMWGRRLGIEEKTYNDALGARWFASSWVSLDFALDIVRILGVDRIGPLSLQSIALRERHSDRILHRLDQLETFNISIGTSSYAKAIRHFAAVDDHEALTDLLQSDMHPDVFDDLNIQRQILGSAVLLGDWRKYRLILAVRLAVSLDSVALASNALLSACLESGNWQMTLRVLEDMSARGVQVFPSTSDAISMHIISHVSPHADDGPQIDLRFYVTLCRRIMSMRFPLATDAVRTILFRLAREGHIEDFERLSLEILRRYRSFQMSERATLNIHKLDVPDITKEESHYRSFQMIPRDLGLSHELHPVQRIFDKKMQQCIVRCAFRRTTLYRQKSTSPEMAAALRRPTQPADFGLARGVRLVALWKERGVFVHDVVLRKAIEVRLADLFGTELPAPRRLQSSSSVNMLSLAEAKALCDMAWGSEILPPLPELEERVKKLGRSRAEQWFAFVQSRKSREV
ncbi:hypothetical protein VTK73DRAFT_8123 [Phialemonium thermophilum]|uniref:Pentatricopeptide repeat domain-containing protein n=1 Tax=Phialemonium thermophilum TaxID=223376 RepID=A0ABR3XPZ6_9PEZI